MFYQEVVGTEIIWWVGLLKLFYNPSWFPLLKKLHLHPRLCYCLTVGCNLTVCWNPRKVSQWTSFVSNFVLVPWTATFNLDIFSWGPCLGVGGAGRTPDFQTLRFSLAGCSRRPLPSSPARPPWLLTSACSALRFGPAWPPQGGTQNYNSRCALTRGASTGRIISLDLDTIFPRAN